MIARTSSSAWVRGVVEMFAAEGIDVLALFRDAGLDIAVLHDPAGRFSIDDISALWEMAVSRSGNVRLGLRRDLALTYGKLGIVGHAMMACPTLLAALQGLVRSMNVVSNAATFSLSADVDGHWFELGHLGGERPVPRQRVEFGMLTMLGFCSWITGRELQARAVEFVYPAPDDPGPHLAAFGCCVRFGCAANRALLRQHDLDLPLSARDPDMAALHARLIDQELERLEGARTGHQVRRLLGARLAHAEPRRKDIADALNISERTLQRRLHAEHTSFQKLLDDTRRELAQQYLRRPRHSLRRIADLLGFEDQSNLFRACKRWFGESPRTYQARFGVAGEKSVPP
jgi:AraC-like DNA-binding protein